jgi:hypothetical protein
MVHTQSNANWKNDGSSRYPNSIRARQTRPAGSVREREMIASSASSSSPIARSLTRRGAAMTNALALIPRAYHMSRCGWNPLQLIDFKESLY